MTRVLIADDDHLVLATLGAFLRDAAPGVCVDLGPGPRCEAPCDAMHPCATPQACVFLQGVGFGVCR